MTGDLGLDCSDVAGFYAAKEIQQLKNELKATSTRLAAAEQRAERLAGMLTEILEEARSELPVDMMYADIGEYYRAKVRRIAALAALADCGLLS